MTRFHHYPDRDGDDQRDLDDLEPPDDAFIDDGDDDQVDEDLDDELADLDHFEDDDDEEPPP